MTSKVKVSKDSLKGDATHVELSESQSPGTDDTDMDLNDNHWLYLNKWARWRTMIQEPAAEFLGTMILVLFADGVACQVALGANPEVASTPKGNNISTSFGGGIGIALAVWISGGISGGHVNPAVTLSLAVFRGFPWKKVPIYMFAQVMGALCGAACLYANYFHAIDIVEGGRGIRTISGTGGLFATYSLPYMTPVSCFFNEFLGTALLLIVIFAATDEGNFAPPRGMYPLVLFFAVLGIAAAFGMQTGSAINPARDLGPRLLTAMVGYGGHVFSYRDQYWFWCPILGPLSGGLVGSLLYDVFVFVGPKSILSLSDASAQADYEKVRRGGRGKLSKRIDAV